MNDNMEPVNRTAITCVIVLCVVACTLTLLLPGDSLVVDLIYRGF